jgi:hypothetical protein
LGALLEQHMDNGQGRSGQSAGEGEERDTYEDDGEVLTPADRALI